MSIASELIERAEEEGGGLFDDPNSNALAVLFGALSRELGKHDFQEKDDLIVGLLIQDEIAHGEENRRSNEVISALLQNGLSPDDVKLLLG